jgi:hypothetical protein
MDNAIMFIGMNIPEEIQNLLNEQEVNITNGMTHSEIKAYKLGIRNTLSTLTSLVNTFDEHVVIHTINTKYHCELDIKDLNEMINE